MAITLTKIHTGDHIVDDTREWGPVAERGIVTGRNNDGTFAIVWPEDDGLETAETLATLSAPGWYVECTHSN
jgi:hypothetical protein